MRKQAPRTAGVPAPVAPSLEKTCSDEPERVATSGLRDKPEEQCGQGGRNPPADDTGPLHSDGESRRTEEQSEMGLCMRSVGHDALPDVTPAGKGDRANGKQGTEGDDRQEGQRFRGSERLELLDPAQRRSPDQPVEAHSGVCDQAEGVADPEEGGAEGGGLAAGGRKLAGEGPDGQEHDSCSHHCQGEVQRGTHGDPYVRAPSRQDGDDGGCHPKCDGAHPKPADRQSGRAPSCRQAREQEVPAAGVLFAAEQPRAGQEPPHRTEDHECHGDLEGCEATHGLELRCRTEECAHRLVRSVGGGEGVALSCVGVDLDVADLRRSDGEAEDKPPKDSRTSSFAGGHQGDDRPG